MYKRSKRRTEYSTKWEREMCGSMYRYIRYRCNNPKNNRYRWYGEKGIKCLVTRLEIKSLIDAASLCPDCGIQMDRSHGRHGMTIDRLDTEGHYELSNMRVCCRSCNVKKAWREGRKDGVGE